jgi:hypothetical protein
LAARAAKSASMGKYKWGQFTARGRRG